MNKLVKGSMLFLFVIFTLPAATASAQTSVMNKAQARFAEKVSAIDRILATRWEFNTEMELNLSKDQQTKVYKINPLINSLSSEIMNLGEQIGDSGNATKQEVWDQIDAKCAELVENNERFRELLTPKQLAHLDERVFSSMVKQQGNVANVMITSFPERLGLSENQIENMKLVREKHRAAIETHLDDINQKLTRLQEGDLERVRSQLTKDQDNTLAKIITCIIDFGKESEEQKQGDKE